MSFSGIIEMDLRNLATEVKKKAPEIRKDAESGIETLLVLTKKYGDNIKKLRSTDYVSPFIDCLNNENVSQKAHEIALSGLNHVLSYNLAGDATASTIVDILNDRLDSEETSSMFGLHIIQIFPVLLANSSFIIPERKLQNVLYHIACILCAEDSSSPVYSGAFACFQQMLISLCKHTTTYSEQNEKRSSSKINDKIREKAPKSLSDNIYAAALWSVLQDLSARLSDQEAAWLSNGKDVATVRLSVSLCLEVCEQLLPACVELVQRRVEFAQLLQFLLVPAVAEKMKSEDVEMGMMLLLLRVVKKLTQSFYMCVPAVEGLLSTLAGQIKRVVKKKVNSEIGLLLMELTLDLLSDATVVCALQKEFPKAYSALVEQLIKLLQRSIKSIDMNTLIGQFQKFGTRFFKDLKKAQPDEEESEGEENEGDETMCVMALHCIRSVIEACGVAVANLAKTYL